VGATGADVAPAPVTALLFDAFGGGGVARTVINLANHLARRRDVELVSLFRGRPEPRFDIDPGVRLTVLRQDDAPTGDLHEALTRRPTLLRPRPAEPRMSLLTDLLLCRRLRSLPAGILLTTRPSLHLAAARFAPRDQVVVGQDHSNFATRFANPAQASVLDWTVPRLDALAVLTEADAVDYRDRFPNATTLVRCMPNALPWPVAAEPAPLDAKVVVTAGRIDDGKGHARMVRAFAAVADRHPDWQLHIYGSGPARPAVDALVTELGLEGQVRLLGYTHDLKAVLAQASVFALTSHAEGFSMVLTEAMSVGLPPVAMDCPRGPGEIISDGHNGRLVPDGDGPGFSAALLALVEDPVLRRRMGAQAHQDARAYEMERVGAQWERLFAEVTASRHG
jgi:glycosyltransferase involved in cell wall biosynthesis